ncbi:helix-turn-helix domain-containing protein [Clostridioides difficile]
MYPNKNNKSYLQTFGCCRFVY